MHTEPSFEPLTAPQILRKGATFYEGIDDRRDTVKDDFSYSMIKSSLNKSKSEKKKEDKSEKNEAAKRTDEVSKKAKYLMWTWVGA